MPIILQSAENSEVLKMVTVGTSHEDWELYRQMAEQNPSKLYFSAGLHPLYVDQFWEVQLSRLFDIWDREPLPVALGEVGLDYYHLPKNPALAKEIVNNQKNAFREQLKFGKKLQTSLIVHSRSAFEDCVIMIDESGFDWNRVVFHCFSEKVEQINKLKERGAWVSFTGMLTYSANDELRDAFVSYGLNCLMIETDSPYLAPVPKRGKENEPAFLAHLGEYAAELVGMSTNEFSERIYGNTNSFYKIEN